MKNNHQKLNEVFADIDGAFINRASTPPKRSVKPFYIGLIAALLALITLALSVLPGFLEGEGPPALPPVTPSPESSALNESPSESSDSQTPALTPSENLMSPEPPSNGEPSPVEPSDEPSIPVDPPVDPPVEPTVPAWYTPGDLTVLSLTRVSAKTTPAAISAPAASGKIGSKAVNQTLTLTESSAALQPISGRYVNLTALAKDSAHNEHGCLLYDVQSGEMICYSCLAKEVLSEPLKEGECIVIDPMTTASLVSFAIYKEEGNIITARYIYEPEKELLRKVPLLSDQDFGLYTVSPDGRYLLTASLRQDGSGYYDYYLIDVETLTPKSVSDGHPTFGEAHFSPDGKTLFIVLEQEYRETYFDTDKVKHLMVNADTGTSTICEGKILSYANGLLVTRYRADYHVYDRQSICEIKIPNNTYAFETRQGNIVRINVQSGTQEILTAIPDAWALSNDGLYAYAYTTGSSSLTVYSLESGKHFTVEVSAQFASAVKELQKTKNIRYFISLNNEGNELLICYSISTKTSKPKDNTHDAINAAFVKSNSIIDFVVNFEELCTVVHTYKVYKGEGFTQFFVADYVLVEDYRVGTFTIYTDVAYKHTGISLVNEEWIVALNASKEETDMFLKNKGLRADTPPTVDYADFYVNGKFSPFEARNFVTTPAYLDQISGFYPWFNRSVASITGDKTYLRLFMAELNDCEKTFTASAPFKERDAVTLAQISYAPNEVRFWGTLCTKGVYRIMAWNNEYFVPEYVFADFVTLAAFTEFKSANKLNEGKNMTVEELRAIVERGPSKDDFSGYAYRKLYDDSSTGERRLLPVYEGEEQIGYVYIRIRPNGNVEHLTLFDTDYRYISFPEIEGFPEGEWIYKGHIDFKAD